MGSEDEAVEELAAIQAIYPELLLDPEDPRSAHLDLDVIPSKPLSITFRPTFTLESVKSLSISSNGLAGNVESIESRAQNTVEPIYRTHEFSHLPSLRLDIHLPLGYPQSEPPRCSLSVSPLWIPRGIIEKLEGYVKELWEEYGRSQVVFGYIDFLQSQIDAGFDLVRGELVASTTLEQSLREFEYDAKKRKFESRSFDCGVCLYPKKGLMCYEMRRCGHVFCVECLQDFYGSAIKEGSVETVTCLDPTCGKEGRKRPKSLHPTELLEIPLSRDQVQRYVDLRLKKMLESDKTTIYCPRQWCQAPARSAKYQKYNTDKLEDWPEDSDEDSADQSPDDLSSEQAVNTNLSNMKNANADRLAVCSRCQHAFCHVCGKSWHGDFVICKPKTAQTVAEEDKASFDFIRLHTSPCPYCDAPTQKVMGCNHMICGQCRTHFCYLCSSWLTAGNPYEHFNTKGTPCYQRLWELEEGDEGEAHADPAIFGGLRGLEHQAFEFAQQFNEDPAPDSDDDGINQDGLQRFLALAAVDEEDGWESDELDARPAAQVR